MTRIKTFIVITLLIISSSVLFAAPNVTVIFEYTVGPDGSRRNLHVFRVEDPRTHRELKGALTQKELQLGLNIITKRKPSSSKEAGKKLYEIELFDMATHRYYGQ